MRRERFPWVDSYQFVGSNVTPDGVRINFPFDPAFPVDVGFFTGSGRHLVRANRHEFLEVIYLYGGSMDMQIRNRLFRLKKGDVVVIGPNIHKQLLYKPNVEAKLIGLNFQPEVIRSGAAEGEDEIYLTPFLCQGPRFPHVISGGGAMSREVIRLLLRVYKELPARTTLNRLTAKTYLRELFLLLARHYRGYVETQQAMDRKQKDLDRLRPLFQVLNERYAEHIEVRDAARICAMSPSYFMRFFKLTIGQSFRAYLNGFRIEKARSMLSSGNTSIAEISQLVGFCSQSYFGEVFRVVVGMTPRTFRRRFGTKNQLPRESDLSYPQPQAGQQVRMAV
jgi:AraC-like DNA-binding protein/mannose-6-phosphate isomerase-like protein (cupin superfamily)